MKRVKHHPWLKAMLVALCSVLSCFALAIGVGLPVSRGVAADGDVTEPAAETYELTQVDLNIRDGYVFTSDLLPEQMYDLVEVTVTYTQVLEDGSTETPKTETYKLNLTGTGNTRKAETGEEVTFSQADGQITAAVTPKEGYNAAATLEDGTLAVSYGTAVRNGITATYNGDAINSNYNGGFNTPTFQNRITVKYTKNNGTIEEGVVITNSEFSVNGNLFPDSVPASGITGTYSKKMTVVMYNNPEYTTEVEITNITFVTSFNILNISGELAQQFARKSLTFENNSLEMNALYNNGVFVSVSLSKYDVKSFDTANVKYYAEFDEESGTGRNEIQDLTVLTTEVQAIQFTFTFPGTSLSTTVTRPIRINPIQIETPYFDINGAGKGNGTLSNPLVLNYSNDANIVIGMPSYSDYMDTKLSNNGLPSVNLNVTGGNNNKPDSVVLGTNDGTADTLGTNKIEFLQPNATYTIELKLDAGDFQWAMPHNGGTRNENADTITYVVFIDKAFYDASLTGYTKKITYNGSSIDVGGSISATPRVGDWIGSEPSFTWIKDPAVGEAWDKAVAEYLTDTENNTIPAEENLTFNYHLQYYDVDDNGEITGSPKYEAPKYAGRYKIKVIVHTNEYYYGTEYYGDKIPTYDVTIDPKPLNVNSIVKSITYDAAEHEATDFLNTTGFISSDLLSGNAPITVTTDADGKVAFTKKQYWQENGYAVYLKIDNENYIWGESVPDDYWTKNDAEKAKLRQTSASFVIDKLRIQYSVTQNDFYYGESSSISANVAESLKKYLIDPNIKYTGGSLAAPTSDRSNIDKWDASDNLFTVTYTPVYKGGNNAEENSLNLVAASCDFTIKKAQLKRVDISDDSRVYSGSALTFNFTNWLVLENGGFGKYASDKTGIMNRTVTGTGTRAFYVSIPTLAADASSIGLTSVDTYTVSISIKDTTNFEWVKDADNTDGNKTVTWTITKKGVGTLSDPADDTYDTTAKTASFVGNWDAELMTIKSVTGKTFANTDIASSTFSFNDDAGTVTATNAGTYTATVALKNIYDYTWGENSADNSADVTLTYVINRAAVALFETQSNIDFDEKADEQKKPVLQAKNADGTNTAEANLTLTYIIYNENAPTIALTAITAAGTYKLKVEADSVLSGTQKDNYVVSTELVYTYTVNSRGLVKPTIDVTELKYNGQLQSIYELITNRMSGKVDIYGNRIVMVIKAGDTIVDDDDIRSIKDVYLVGDTVTAYDVFITPATNYTWDDDSVTPVKFSIKITQLEVEIDWGTLTATYGDADIKVEPVVTNKANDADAVGIVIGYSTAGGAAFSSTTPAGNYTVTATGLDGAAKNNYKCSTTNENYTATFKIKKQVLTIPELGNVTGREYADGKGDVTYATSETASKWAELADKGVTATVQRANPWLNPATTPSNDSAASFDVRESKFAFVNAGDYYIVFTLTDSKNYCLSAGQQTEFTKADNYATAQIKFITVERKKISAPNLNKPELVARAQEWGKFSSDALALGEKVGDDRTVTIDGVAVKVRYGKRTTTDNINYVYDTASLSADVLGSASSGAIGQYYILLEVNGTDGVELNYVWGDSQDEHSTFVVGNDTKEYAAGQVAIRLHYAITSTQLPLEFNDLTYEFGDNGIVGAKTPASLFSLLEKKLKNPEIFGGTGMSFVETNISFAENKEFTYQEGKGTGTVELENGLPWNVGEYVGKFTINFSNTNYQPLPVTINISVTARPIEVEWIADLFKIYDGVNADLSAVATMINVPKRSGGTEADKPTLIVTTSDTSDGNIKNFKEGGYSISVTDLDFDGGAENFTLTGAVDNSATYTVNKRAVTIVGVSKSDHVYGETLPSGNGVAWQYGSGSLQLVGTDANNIVVKIKNADADTSDLGAMPDVGEYKIVPQWKDGVDGADNYDFTFGSAAFEVVEREIVLTFADVNKTYFDFSDSYYDSAWTAALADSMAGKATGDAIVNNDKPFTVVAYEDTGKTTAISANTSVGRYSIYITQTDGNYAITVSGATLVKDTETETTAKYNIDEAELENVKVAGYSGVYDGNAHELFTTLDATAKNDQTLVWYYSTDGEHWTEYKNGDSPSKFTITDVADSASYYVKVTADNHNDYIYRVDGADKTAVPVTVSNAQFVYDSDTIVASLSRAVTYSAAQHNYLPDNFDTLVTGVKLTNNNLKWFIRLEGGSEEEYKKATPSGQVNAGTYNFTLRVTADNHNDATIGTVTLKINQAEIFVGLKLEIFYHEANPADMSYMMRVGDLVNISNADKFIIADNAFKSQADKNAFYADTLLTAGSSFTYTVPGYIKGNDVGRYRIELNVDGLKSTNYKFTNASNGNELNVKQLPVTVTIDPYTATYNQARDTLTPLAAKVNCTQVGTYGGVIDITDIAVTNIVTSITTDALLDGDITTNNVKYADAEHNEYAGYDIKIKTSDNFAVAYTTAKYTIKRATNAITTEDYHLFVTADLASTANSPTAWTYGDKVDVDNPKGYDKDGAHKLQTLALVSRDNDLQITIKRGGSMIAQRTAVGGADATDATTFLNSAFAEIYASAASFAAGDYEVSFVMDRNIGEGKLDNFEAFNETWKFTVAKKEVTVTPSSLKVVYGEDIATAVKASDATLAGGYVYDCSPLAGYNGKVDELNKVISFVFDSFDRADNSKRTYAPGWNADAYDIKVVVNGTFTDYNDTKDVETDNYVFCFGLAALTVTKREVSIEINPAHNHYMLIGAYNNDPNDPKYDDEDAWLLDSSYGGNKYSVKSGTFYNDVVPFEIATEALNYGSGAVTGTKDHGRYAIYAEFIDETFQGNYSLTVVNTAYDDGVIVPTLTDLMVKSGGELRGGIFTVEKAQLYMSVSGPYYEENGEYKLYSDSAVAGDAGVYDGRAKHYQAVAALGNKAGLAGSVPTFVPEYYQGQTLLDGAPKNKGNYSVRFVVAEGSSNDNFEQTPSQSQGFNIAARSLTVSSSLSGANYKFTYNGSAQNVDFRFFDIVAADELKIEVAINGTKKSYPLASGNTNRIHTEAFENVITGGYTVEIALSADMTNYTLRDGVVTADKEYTAGGKYTCKLDIEKMVLYVWIKDATVQYGTTVFNADGTLATKDARFSGFNVAYGTTSSEVNETAEDLLKIINDNKKVGYFVDAVDGIMFNATNTDLGGRYAATHASGSVFAITMPNLSATNFDVTNRRQGSLTVTQRNINVTVSGAESDNNFAKRVYNGIDNSGSDHFDYLNKNLNAHLGSFLTASENAFGASGDDLSSFNVKLTLSASASNVKNVGSYNLTVSYDNSNYNIRFLGSPTYEITPATLKVKVQAAGTAFTEGEVRLGVIYGSDVSGYGVSYSGFVNGESSTELSGITTEYSFKYGDKSYEAYKSRVGEVYGASVRFGSASNGYQPLVNYTIAYDDTTKLDISPLKISVAVEESNIYREAADGYHDGVYGASMEAGVTLAGYDSAKSGAEFAPKFTRTYNTSDASHNGVKYQEAGKAPRRVDKYTVTVALETNGVGTNNYDYCFDDGVYSVTRDYEIKQQSISLAWTNTTIHSDETDKSNSIANYRDSIMTILTFTRDSAQLDIADCTLSDDVPGLTYEAANAAGRYTVTVLLNELARNNYCWEAPIDADKTQTSAFFTITGQGVVVIGDQSILGWVYGEYGAANAPAATLYPHGSSDPVADATLLYYFALVTGGNTDGVTMTGNVLNGFNSNDYASVGAFTLGVPTNAGVYVMRVDFDGNATYQRANSVYYIFRVEKKGIDKPTVEASDYNEVGGEVAVSRSVVGFDSSAMRIVGFDGVQTSYSGTSLTVSTVNANEAGYNIRVELSDPNYYWNGDADATVIDVKWIVRPATNNNVVWDASYPGREYEYGTPYTIAAKATYSVNGVITYSYADRTVFTDVNAVTTWTSGLPVNAGKYWIKATSSSNNGNYNEKFVTTAFEITKATLHVRPSGSAQYGDLKDSDSVFSFSRYDFVDTDSFGFKRDDTAEAVRNTINRNGVTYTVAGTDSGAWAVDDYDLTVTATHLNYDVVCVTGTFTVTKRALVVSIGRNGASYYRHAIDYSNVTITIVSNLVDENDRASIIAAIRAELDAGLDETSDAGTYPLGVKSSLVLDNYTVSATPGTYTINRLPVRVVANWGGYAFGSKDVVLPSISEVYDNTTKLTLTADELALFTFVYGSSTTAPTAAGSHPVSVHVASNSNYILTNSVSGLFVITLTELDAELIEWETVYFDTVCAKPQVTGIKNDAFSASMFDIEYIGDWNRAGVPYIIRLTLNSPESTKWKTVEGVTRDLTYTIAQGKNALVENISINGWVYGEYSVDSNLPTARAKFGAVVFEYSDAMDGVYTTAAPANGDVGTYWVRAVVEGTTDYERFVSPEPVHFEITKKTISAPELNIITEGYGQNNVYIGSAMQADVNGYDSTLMYIRYDDGAMIVNGNSIKVIATNAGSYHVTVTLVQSDNYAWATGTELDGDGNAVLTWTIARRKLTKPTDNDATLIVNGQELKYFPIGFDDATMGITGNTSGYGGTFTATVSIKDTDNYEWADGTTDDITFEWNVVGADTVFVVVISILSSLAGVAAIGAGVQLYFYLKKRKEEKAN